MYIRAYQHKLFCFEHRIFNKKKKSYLLDDFYFVNISIYKSVKYNSEHTVKEIWQNIIVMHLFVLLNK